MTDPSLNSKGDPPAHLIAVQLDTLSVQEAAEALGVTPKTIRRRIKQGTLQSFKQPTSQGYEWRVRLDGQVDTQGIQVDTQPTEMGRDVDSPAPSLGGQVDTQGAAEVALKALSVLEQIEHEHRAEVEQLRRDNQQRPASSALCKRNSSRHRSRSGCCRRRRMSPSRRPSLSRCGRDRGGGDYSVRSISVDAKYPIDDDEWAQTWQELTGLLGQMARSVCGTCAGSGMCAGCRGYGRILVRDRGSFKCSRCQGDGACTACKGTGQAFPA